MDGERAESPATIGGPATNGEAAVRRNVELVHSQLRDAIRRGEFAPGQELSQVRLAERLGVSRTPLREALRLLQREGFVEAHRNRSFRVTSISLPDLEQLYVTSLPLEATAIRLTIPQLVSADIAALEGYMAQMAHYAGLHDFDGWEGPHRAFHRGLVVHAGRRMVELLDQLSDHAERYRRVYLAGEDRAWDRTATEHRAILDACKDGDADLAAGRLARHLAATALNVMGMVDPAYEPSALRVALAVAESPAGPQYGDG